MTKFEPFADVPGEDWTKTFADVFAAADRARADAAKEAEVSEMSTARVDAIRQRLAAYALTGPWNRPWHEDAAEFIANAPHDIEWLLTELDKTHAEAEVAWDVSGNAESDHAEAVRDLAEVQRQLAVQRRANRELTAQLAAANDATERAHVTINDLCARAWLAEETAR